MQIMPPIYLKSSTCKYLSLDNGVTMTSKRRENINLVSFICLSFLVISFSKQLIIIIIIIIIVIIIIIIIISVYEKGVNEKLKQNDCTKMFSRKVE